MALRMRFRHKQPEAAPLNTVRTLRRSGSSKEALQVRRADNRRFRYATAGQIRCVSEGGTRLAFGSYMRAFVRSCGVFAVSAWRPTIARHADDLVCLSQKPPCRNTRRTCNRPLLRAPALPLGLPPPPWPEVPRHKLAARSPPSLHGCGKRCRSGKPRRRRLRKRRRRPWRWQKLRAPKRQLPIPLRQPKAADGVHRTAQPCSGVGNILCLLEV